MKIWLTTIMFLKTLLYHISLIVAAFLYFGLEAYL